MQGLAFIQLQNTGQPDLETSVSLGGIGAVQKSSSYKERVHIPNLILTTVGGTSNVRGEYLGTIGRDPSCFQAQPVT